jgi:hypothetical protein
MQGLKLVRGHHMEDNFVQQIPEVKGFGDRESEPKGIVVHLFQRIENPNEVPLQIVTPTSVIIRQSCGAAG